MFRVVVRSYPLIVRIVLHRFSFDRCLLESRAESSMQEQETMAVAMTSKRVVSSSCLCSNRVNESKRKEVAQLFVLHSACTCSFSKLVSLSPSPLLAQADSLISSLFGSLMLVVNNICSPQMLTRFTLIYDFTKSNARDLLLFSTCSWLSLHCQCILTTSTALLLLFPSLRFVGRES